MDIFYGWVSEKVYVELKMAQILIITIISRGSCLISQLDGFFFIEIEYDQRSDCVLFEFCYIIFYSNFGKS